MKWSTSFLALAVAPLAMARNVHNVYPASVARGTEPKVDARSLAVANGLSGYGITANSLTEIIIIWANPGGGAATTTYNNKVTVTQTVTAGSGETAAAAAPGATHTVKVGGPAGLVYQPDQLNNVPVGDTVIFEFLSQNHTVTQSAFDTPCKKLGGGMDSGFQPNPNNTVSPPPQVALQVMATTPLWFYCRQKGHCGEGMVFSINPTAEKTQAQFQQMAIAQNGTGEATPITGGSGGNTQPPAESNSAAATSTAAAESAQQTSPPAGGDGSGVTPGQGSLGSDGSCTCFVQCSAGSFPVNAQGIGAYGGWGGSLPMSMGSMG